MGNNVAWILEGWPQDTCWKEVLYAWGDNTDQYSDHSMVPRQITSVYIRICLYSQKPCKLRIVTWFFVALKIEPQRDKATIQDPSALWLLDLWNMKQGMVRMVLLDTRGISFPRNMHSLRWNVGNPHWWLVHHYPAKGTMYSVGHRQAWSPEDTKNRIRAYSMC